MAVTYNLEHAQVSADGTTFLDVPGVTTLEATISSTSNYLAADGGKYAVAWSAPEGSGSLAFAESDYAMMVVINGGRLSTSGVTPNLITRYEQPGTATNPNFVLSGLAKNVSAKTPDEAAFRITIPAVNAAPATIALGQETWGEWSSDIGFVADDNDTMVIYENLESMPTMTDGVYAVNLTPPAP